MFEHALKHLDRAGPFGLMKQKNRTAPRVSGVKVEADAVIYIINVNMIIEMNGVSVVIKHQRDYLAFQTKPVVLFSHCRVSAKLRLGNNKKTES